MITFQPLTDWPGEKTRHHENCRFKAGYDSTLAILKYELARLDAKNVIILADCAPTDIRRDGLLRGDCRPRSSGIILTLECKHGALQYPCDTYWDWKDNLRAIALALECLRTVDRYGVTKRGEQYSGWARLPAPEQANGFKNADEAAAWLCQESGFAPWPAIVANRTNFDTAYRNAAKRLHPDVSGGDTAKFQKLQQCKEILEKFFLGR